MLCDVKERNGRKRLEIDVFNKCFVSDSVDRAHEAPVGSLWTSTSVAVPSASVTFLSSHLALCCCCCQLWFLHCLLTCTDWFLTHDCPVHYCRHMVAPARCPTLHLDFPKSTLTQLDSCLLWYTPLFMNLFLCCHDESP